ncbi:MAG: hypothetical protein QOH06_5309 [Acidobacteriota bacterium]|jgi:hypothetical protein|nr:hypothetical protein [Acidobacteriota bacterium]
MWKEMTARRIRAHFGTGMDTSGKLLAEVMTTLDTQVTVPSGVMFRDLEGEAVVLALESGRYFGLNETGTRMWLLLLEHGKVESAYRALQQEYEVAGERLEQELLEFVNSLAAEGLVLIHED